MTQTLDPETTSGSSDPQATFTCVLDGGPSPYPLRPALAGRITVPVLLARTTSAVRSVEAPSTTMTKVDDNPAHDLPTGITWITMPGKEREKPLMLALNDEKNTVYFIPEDEWPDGAHAFRARMILEGKLDSAVFGGKTFYQARG